MNKKKVLDLKWFNISSKELHPFKQYFRLWNLFVRDSTGGFWWGFGIFQINQRHLFYIGHNGLSILWLFRPIKSTEILSQYKRKKNKRKTSN